MEPRIQTKFRLIESIQMYKELLKILLLRVEITK